jgi:hypothetical protein
VIVLFAPNPPQLKRPARRSPQGLHQRPRDRRTSVRVGIGALRRAGCCRADRSPFARRSQTDAGAVGNLDVASGKDGRRIDRAAAAAAARGSDDKKVIADERFAFRWKSSVELDHPVRDEELAEPARCVASHRVRLEER